MILRNGFVSNSSSSATIVYIANNAKLTVSDKDIGMAVGDVHYGEDDGDSVSFAKVRTALKRVAKVLHKGNAVFAEWSESIEERIALSLIEEGTPAGVKRVQTIEISNDSTDFVYDANNLKVQKAKR